MNSKIEKLIPILRETCSQMEGLKLKEQDKQKANESGPLNSFFIDILIRFNENLNAIGILLENTRETDYTTLDYPIGLILRSALTDSLRCFFVISRLDEEIDGKNGYGDLNRQRQLMILFNKDQLPRHEKELKKLLRLSKGTELFEPYSKYLPEFQRVFGNELLEIENEKSLATKTTWGMVDEIISNDRFNLDGYWLYNFWITYSTYEHYGAITSKLHLNDKFEISKVDNLLKSINYVYHGMEYLFALKQYSAAKDYMSEKKEEVVAIINS